MTESPPSDRQIVDAVLSGKRDAFRVLVERESKQVIGVCQRILRDPTDAQDAAQDAFAQAYVSLATFRADGPFGAWLRRIAVRVAIARLASRRDLGTLDGEQLHPRAASLKAADDPESLALSAEYRSLVIDAIRRLPAAQRDVVLMRYYGELTLQEIAFASGQPVGTVKSRLSRGVAGLRDQLTTRSIS